MCIRDSSSSSSSSTASSSSPSSSASSSSSSSSSSASSSSRAPRRLRLLCRVASECASSEWRVGSSGSPQSACFGLTSYLEPA
eukprot:532337-Rhodomonas_salina.1